jgi:hypothetical protein
MGEGIREGTRDTMLAPPVAGGGLSSSDQANRPSRLN